MAFIHFYVFNNALFFLYRNQPYAKNYRRKHFARNYKVNENYLETSYCILFFHKTIRFTDKKCKLESHTVIKSLC